MYKINFQLQKKQIENFLKEDKDNALLYQLQFAYFKIQKANIEKRISFLESSFNENRNLIYSSINKIKIEEEKLVIDKKKSI